MRSERIQKTVKAFESDIALINERARALGCSAAEVIHELCRNLRKELYLKELSESFDSMVREPQAFAELQREQDLWDSTLSDGLDDAT